MTENSGGGAAIFDLDGTLTDSKPGIVSCLRATLLAYGVQRTDVELEACIGPPMEMTMNRMLNPMGNPEGERRAEAAAIQYRECYGATGWAENSVYAGIPELLELLQAGGVHLYVCTSKRHDFAERIINKFELAKYFKAVYGDPVDAALPGKAELLARLIQRERIAPEQAVMIGDRKFDIAAGKANGLKTIGVTFGYGSREELETAGADAVCESSADIFGAVMMMSSQGEV